MAVRTADVSPAPRLGYRPALDGLRGVAILAVLGHHVGVLLLPDSWGPDVLPAGFLGVDLFFVLSGFLITTLLLERASEPSRIRRFYARRALRLFPAVGALLAVCATVALLAGVDPTQVVNTIVVVATYATNWATLQGVTILPQLTHLWSLAVEEQFYLLWPALLWGLLALRFPRRALLTVALLLALASASWRALLWERGELGVQLYFRSDTRADGLLLGAALALVPLSRLQALPRAPVLASAVVGTVVLVAAAQGLELTSAALYLGGFTAVALAAVALIVAALDASSPAGRLLGAPWLVAVGLASYTLYLWHFPVFMVVRDQMGGLPWPARMLVGLSATALLTVLSRRLVERPALALKTRLF